MIKTNNITVFEHQRLYIDEHGFTRKHLDALLKLNEYHGGTYFEPIAKGIKFNQYVGVIQVDGLTIEIHPKADKNDDDSKWKGVLLQMLQACGKLKASTAGAANVKRQHLNLLEVYFELYLNELDKLIRQGLVKKYRKKTSNVKALKGKLEFAGNIQHNVVHKERFYTTHQVYDQDHILHQILYNALEIVEQFCRGNYLYDRCKRVILNFPEVQRIKVSNSQLEKIKLTRKTASYQYPLEIARLIILHYSPDISSGKEKMLSLLFDMNQLWEEYILIQLRKALQNTNYVVTGQDTREFLGSNYLKPDIVIQNKFDKSEIYIIDTKWKNVGTSAASVQDLRQMYAYGRFWDAKKMMLLYPGKPTKNNFRPFKTEDYSNTPDGLKKIDHQCKMGFVSVLNEDDNKLDKTIGEKVFRQLQNS